MCFVVSISDISSRIGGLPIKNAAMPRSLKALPARNAGGLSRSTPLPAARQAGFPDERPAEGNSGDVPAAQRLFNHFGGAISAHADDSGTNFFGKAIGVFCVEGFIGSPALN